METIKHSNGKEVNVSYFGDLQEKLNFSSGYVRAQNSQNEFLESLDGILRPRMDEDVSHPAIIKAHKKFYGLDNKYNGKGNLRAA